jgi:thiamine-phosphate pyrophosphorylase
VDAAQELALDYFAVGPIHATPTKPGRPAVGTGLVEYAAAHAQLPFFAIGGLDEGNLGPVLTAGAERIAVVRAITESADPRRAASGLAHVLESRVGAA